MLGQDSRLIVVLLTKAVHLVALVPRDIDGYKKGISDTDAGHQDLVSDTVGLNRSEERRVGKECPV